MTADRRNGRAFTVDLLRELIDYDPATGAMTWKARGPHIFREGRHGADCVAAIWNEQHAGKPALSTVRSDGYLGGFVLGWPFLAHRVAYTIVHGVRPRGPIAHLDGDPTNNRFDNLRVGTMAKRAKTPGVHYATGRWVASVTFAGKREYLGRFRDRDEALAASRAADARNGFRLAGPAQ